MTSPTTAARKILGARVALTLACVGCGASERDRLQHEVSGLRYDVVQTRQHNDDLKRRMRLTETRNRVLVSLLRGLTAEPGAPSTNAGAQAGVAHQSLAAIDRDLDELALTVWQSRQDIDALRNERKTLQAELQQALDVIEQTRSREQAAHDRLLAMRDALMRHTQSEAGAIDLAIADNRIVLRLPDALLFDRGRAGIKRAGLPVLHTIASALAEVADLELQIAGHTALASADQSGDFASLWHLSAARAASVARVLSERGIAAQRLSTVAYADTRPLDRDLAADHQRRNRRVELVLQPAQSEPATAEHASQTETQGATSTVVPAPDSAAASEAPDAPQPATKDVAPPTSDVTTPSGAQAPIAPAP